MNGLAFRVLSSGVRTGNNILGGISFVLLAKVMGVQQSQGDEIHEMEKAQAEQWLQQTLEDWVLLPCSIVRDSHSEGSGWSEWKASSKRMRRRNPVCLCDMGNKRYWSKLYHFLTSVIHFNMLCWPIAEFETNTFMTLEELGRLWNGKGRRGWGL